MPNDATVDYDTDMDTIRNYVSAVTEMQAKLAFAYSAALEQLQTVFNEPAPGEASPDLTKVMLKAGVKLIEKSTVGAIKASTGADLGPLVDVVHGMSDEVDRAAKAADGRAAAGWIMALRSKIVDGYTHGQSGEDLRRQIEAEYNQNDEGGRGGYIGGIQNELDAVRQIGDLVPTSNAIERTMYEAWINAHSDNDCMDGTGLIELIFADDGSAGSAKVICSLGEKIGARLNTVMSDAGVQNLMDLDVVKRVCRDSQCMCFEGNNAVRKEVLDEDTNTFLSTPDNWQGFTQFST